MSEKQSLDREARLKRLQVICAGFVASQVSASASSCSLVATGSLVESSWRPASSASRLRFRAFGGCIASGPSRHCRGAQRTRQRIG